MSGDIGRLPKWAQHFIHEQAREIDELERQLAQAEGNFGPSNVFIRGSHPDPDLPIGMNKEVRFQFPKPEEQVTQRFIDVRHERAKNRDSLVVQADATILIEPTASNSLRLILVRR